MSYLVVGVKIDQLTFLICLVAFDELLILFEGVVVTFTVLNERDSFDFVEELLVEQHTILDEDLEVVPLVFEFLTIGIENLNKTISDFLGDVAGNLLDIAVGLQI